MTVIDVGCGNGDTVRWLAGAGGPGHRPGRTGTCWPRPWPTRRRPRRSLRRRRGAVTAVRRRQRRSHPLPGQFPPCAGRPHARRHPGMPARAEGGRSGRFRGTGVPRRGLYRAHPPGGGRSRGAGKGLRRAIGARRRLRAGHGREEFFFLERSFADYERLVEFFVDDPDRRAAILQARARKITTGSAPPNRPWSSADFRYRSICRLNILRKGRSAATAGITGSRPGE